MYDFNFTAFEKQGIQRVGELNPYITLACDLRCGYCYMFDFLARAKNQTEIMDPAFLVRMVDFFSRQSNGLDRMTLLGGEPTLHPNITDVCNEVADMPIRELRMTTNGIGLHRLDLDRLKADVFDHVSISIDGVDAATNDSTRGRGTFSKIVETIKLYRQAGIPLSVNYTVTTKNIDSLHETIPFFADLGISIINLHRASMDGNAYKNHELLVNAHQWVKARDDLFAFLNRYGADYPGLKVRIPYTFLTPEQMRDLDYKPIQEQNYHSPDGGHRLIVFPPTNKGKGLSYMSSDLIGQPNAELGRVDKTGLFHWNDHPDNEMIAYQNSGSSNVSTDIKGQDEGLETDQLVRVSHSFKAVIYTDQIAEIVD